MACMGGCGGTLTPKKPMLAAATQRPTGNNVVSSGGKLTFGKPRINKGK